MIDKAACADATRAVVGELFRALGGLSVLGAEQVPATGPVLFCPNHISDCDPLALFVASPRRDLAFMAKSELFDVPVLGRLITFYGAFPVRRDSADRRAIRRAEQVLGGSGALVLFPEGRLSESGVLQELQPGAALIALHTNAAVVPVGLAHTDGFLPYGASLPRPAKLPARVVFGAPIRASMGRHGRAEIEALTAQIEARLRALTGQERRR